MLCERKYGRAGLSAGPLHHRKQGDGACRSPEIQSAACVGLRQEAFPAQKFKISKSTVHKDLSERLPAFNRPLYLQAKQVLEENKAERHIRGGLATRKKYKGE